MTDSCPHFLALPGPSGLCFFFMRPRDQTPVKFHPYCGNKARAEVECSTGGYLYPQFFPAGGQPRGPVMPMTLEAAPGPDGISTGPKPKKRQPRRKKGKW